MKIMWSVVSGFIFLGTFLSVVTGKEWPPFSPYPMYSWPISTDDILIYRVVPTNSSNPDLLKKIIDINTTRTLTSIMTSGLARKVPAQEIASGLLDYYHDKIDRLLPSGEDPIKLRLEIVHYSHQELRRKIEDVAKAQNWQELDAILKAQSRVIYER